jgi:hypothetical protein
LQLHYCLPARLCCSAPTVSMTQTHQPLSHKQRVRRQRKPRKAMTLLPTILHPTITNTPPTFDFSSPTVPSETPTVVFLMLFCRGISQTHKNTAASQGRFWALAMSIGQTLGCNGCVMSAAINSIKRHDLNSPSTGGNTKYHSRHEAADPGTYTYMEDRGKKVLHYRRHNCGEIEKPLGFPPEVFLQHDGGKRLIIRLLRVSCEASEADTKGSQ